jgi:hypothetical protein
MNSDSSPSFRLRSGQRSAWVFALCLGAGFLPMPGHAREFRIAKQDFPLLAVEIQCPAHCDLPEEVSGVAVDFGLVGEGKFEDPTQVQGSGSGIRTPRIVAGFPENRFDWARFTRPLPGTDLRLAILNELTSSGKSRAYLSLWKPRKDSLEFVRLLPGHFSVPVGEITFQGEPRAEGGGTLLLIQGVGSDAGLNVQAFFAVRLRGRNQVQTVKTLVNRSEIPVAEILARLNEGLAAEEVVDSTLRCELASGRRGAALRCVKSRVRVWHTQEGPRETPLDSETFTVDLAPPRAGSQ